MKPRDGSVSCDQVAQADLKSEPVECASPPCFMGEVDPTYLGFGTDVNGAERYDIPTSGPPCRGNLALNEISLGCFLDAFYARVRRDLLIGPIFAAAIPDTDWPEHMETIRAFWSSALFKTGRYKGNPFGKHQALGVLKPEHFECWLMLFERTAAETFDADAAAELVERAHRIGDSLKAGLFFRPDSAFDRS